MNPTKALLLSRIRPAISNNMAKPKKPAKADWIRTAGFIGDDSMERMEEWNINGSGVSEEIRNVDCDPNSDIINNHNQKGVE